MIYLSFWELVLELTKRFNSGCEFVDWSQLASWSLGRSHQRAKGCSCVGRGRSKDQRQFYLRASRHGIKPDSVKIFPLCSLALRALSPLPLVALGIILSAAVPLHAGTGRYEGKNWALLDAKKTLSAASKVTLAKYPNCDEVTVDEKNVAVYQKNGTAENQDEAFIKVLTEKGKRNWGTFSVHYQLPYSTAEVIKLEIMKSGDQVQAVDVAANEKETIDNSQMEMNIYDPNSKILQVNIPGLEIGDVIHVVSRTTTDRPIIPGGFDDETLLEGRGAIRHLVYEVHAPTDNPLKHLVLRDQVAGTVRYATHPEGNDILVHRWEATNVPAMFPEPSMPPFENVLQRALVTTTPTWEDVSKWYWNLSRPHLEAATPELKKKVMELTKDAPAEMDKVKALFYFVSQKIRYMGLTPEKDRPGFEPHDVCLTFDKKYGVCRDKAALLVTMLREAGVKAYPVLISVGVKKDPEIPNPGFNHAIVAVELAMESKGGVGEQEKGARYILMDPTDEHARDLLPWYDQNQSYLVVRPEGERLRTSPINPPGQNMLQIRTTGRLKAAGELEATSRISFGGANDDIYRGAFSHMKPDDLRRFFEGKLKDAIPGATLASLKVTPSDMLNMAQALQAEVTFSVGGMTAVGHEKAMVTLPWIGQKIGLANLIREGVGLDQRKYPLQTMVACGLDEQIALKLEDRFSGVASLPTRPIVNDAGVGYREGFHSGKGFLECSREFQLKKVEFSPKEYLTLKKTLTDMEDDSRKAPVLTLREGTKVESGEESASGAAMPVASDVIMLDVQKKLDVSDAHTARLHVKFSKKILTYQGKIRESEVKVPYNPACEEARLIKSTVISKTGERREISPGEINVMDANWSASAKRYTGGKILVASLPGVEIGSTIEGEYEITMKEKPFLSGFEFFQIFDELQKKSFQLSAPEGLKIETRVTTGGILPEESKVKEQGSQSFEWKIKEVKALPNERQTPPDWISFPGVSYFVGDFRSYLKELNNTLLERSRSGAHAAELAQKISRKSKSQLETLRAIRDFVAKSIRPAGPSSFTELPLRELSKADTTLAEGYGDDADRAILLHAMLIAAGFHPEFLLASHLSPIPEIQKVATTFPFPESFKAPLLKVTVDGATYYLNDTDQYAELGTTAYDKSLALNLSTQAGEVILAAKQDQDRIDTDYHLSVSDEGKLRMQVESRFYGKDYNEKRRFFSEQHPEERKQYYQELVSGVAQGAHSAGDLITQFDGYPGRMSFTVEVDHFAVVDGNYLYFTLPFTPSLFVLPGGEHRILPFEVPRYRTTLNAEIALPPKFQKIVISPVSKKLEVPSNPAATEGEKMAAGKVEIVATETPGKFSLHEELEAVAGIISPKDYPSLLKLESQLKKKSSSLFLLEKQ